MASAVPECCLVLYTVPRLRPLRNRQEQADAELVMDASAYEKCVDAPSTCINMDAQFNSRVGDSSQHMERRIDCHSRCTPLLVGIKDADSCVHFEAQATMKLVIVLTLLCSALRVLLQTSLPTPVTCYLLISIVSAFSYLLLLAPHWSKKHVCVTYIAHVCFGSTIFAMALAITLQALSGFVRLLLL